MDLTKVFDEASANLMTNESFSDPEKKAFATDFWYRFVTNPLGIGTDEQRRDAAEALADKSLQQIIKPKSHPVSDMISAAENLSDLLNKLSPPKEPGASATRVASR